MTDHKTAVANGIAILDEKVPDWRNKVDVNTLDTGSLYNCVLGQVFGSYGTGMNTLFGLEDYDCWTEPAERNGFEAAMITHSTRDYDGLTDAWCVVLNMSLMDILEEIRLAGKWNDEFQDIYENGSPNDVRRFHAKMMGN